MMKLGQVLLFLILLCLSAFGNIGSVNIPKLYEHFLKTQKVKEKMEKLKNEALDLVKRREKRILILKEQRKESKKRGDDIQRINEEIIFFEEELGIFLFERKKEIQKKEDALEKQVLKAIYQEVRKYAQANNFEIIIDSSVDNVYDSVRQDITQEILSKARGDRRNRALD